MGISRLTLDAGKSKSNMSPATRPGVVRGETRFSTKISASPTSAVRALDCVRRRAAAMIILGAQRHIFFFVFVFDDFDFSEDADGGEFREIVFKTGHFV